MSKNMAMTKRVAAIAAIGIPLAGAMAQTLSPRLVFEGNVTTLAKGGATQAVRVSVQSWGIAGQRGQNGIAHEIPLRGFYVAHLLSGDISTTIDGETTKQPPGAYWTVKPGATMQVKVNGEYAVLETTAVSKQ
jgi:quercetin dioxygenase-like cupin family protein